MFDNIITYALNKKLITERDVPYITNQLAGIFNLSDPHTDDVAPYTDNVEELLKPLLEYAVQQGFLQSTHPDFADLLDSEIMGVFCDRPSHIQQKFSEFSSIQEATDWFYQYSIDVNYVRMHRINKNIQWTSPTPYGDLEMTINLSKPEKDPLVIAAQKNQAQSNYPKCMLCRENEGYFGHISHPARQNLRLIEVSLNNEKWYLQYSPYIYYHQHAILLSAEHREMAINKKAFQNILGFLEQFPHYFAGSNADLPIVGGSILSHDHYQAGLHTFPVNKAKILKSYLHEGVECAILHWPLNIVRLSSPDKEKVIALADSLLTFWRGYSDPTLDIFAFTGDTPHNTITPIARKNGDNYELYLTLRNNFTTPEHPLGLYHPHQEYHHIKKENIGLIEVMGLAILPGRLSVEIESMKDYLLSQKSNDDIASHREWLDTLATKHTFTKENIHDILLQEIGEVFYKALENCGVFKNLEDFDNFVQKWVNQ